MKRTRLKVCCISSVEEAMTAISAGADALGLVAKMPGGPGVISDELIYDISRRVPPPVATFILTSETEAQEIVDHHKRTGTGVIQIVDHIKLSNYEKMRKKLIGVKLVQVVHIEGCESVDYALEAAKLADALLLDSGKPSCAQKILGGTGMKHDWALSRLIVAKSPVPVFLAGGINPDNVADAINQVRPFGIDLCSGVRTAGGLDEEKLKTLVARMKTADMANAL